MDLSLVLASQGIEHIIERPEEGHGWQVCINGLDHQRAGDAWTAYRAENRRRKWRQTLPLTGMIFDWRSAVWFGVFVLLFVLGETRLYYLREAGLMDNEAVHRGQWWRIFTAVSLHGDIAHLSGNVTIGVLLLGLAMGSFGPGLAVLAAYLAGAGGNLAGLLFAGPLHRSLGASGMVMGALGLLAGQSLAILRRGDNPKQLMVRMVLGACLLLVLLGLDPNTDVLAHVGGFASGALLGAVLSSLNGRLAQHELGNRAAELICAGMVVITWALALRGGR